jgi:hypothetical protein
MGTSFDPNSDFSRAAFYILLTLSGMTYRSLVVVMGRNFVSELRPVGLLYYPPDESECDRASEIG